MCVCQEGGGYQIFPPVIAYSPIPIISLTVAAIVFSGAAQG